MTAIQREQVQAVELSHAVVLTIENHANTDFPDVKHRKPIVSVVSFDTFGAAIDSARNIQAAYVRGEHKVCDVVVMSGPRAGRYHVSQNGRVWTGLARDCSVEAVEVKL